MQVIIHNIFTKNKKESFKNRSLIFSGREFTSLDLGTTSMDLKLWPGAYGGGDSFRDVSI